MESFSSNDPNSTQQRLIRTFEHLHNEKQLNEIDSLINFYFEKKLDDAILKVETENNYTAAIYEEWLDEEKKNGK